MVDEPVVLDKRDFLKATAGGSVLFTTVGLGPGASLAQGGASFVAENFSPESSANVGQEVTAGVTVRNSGDAGGAVTVEYKIDGQFVAENTVQLEAGEARNLSLRGAVPSVTSGEKSQGIYLNGSDTAAVSSTIVINPSTAEFLVESITEFSSAGRAGDSVSITAVVANQGDASGSTDLEYRIGGRVVGERQDLSFNAGERRTVTISGTVPDIAAGTYKQGVFVGASNVGSLVDFTVSATQASFTVDTLDAPSRAQSGASVTARAQVRNTGGTRGTETFRYRIDGTTVASREVTLGADQSQTLAFEGTVPDRSAGSYQQGVFVDTTNAGQSTTIRIDEDPSAKFAVSNLRAPSEGEVGTDITVSADVANTGAERGETRIEYRIKGDRIGRKTVDIRPGRKKTVEFTVTVPALRTGTYEQGVFVGTTARGQTKSLRIRPPAIFTVTALKAPRKATVGDQVSATASLRNRGDATDTKTVQYRIGDRLVEEKEVQLQSGQQRTVSFAGTVPNITAGNYVQGVFVGKQSSTAQLTVNAPPSAAFSLSDFGGATESVVGETVTAAARVRNTGNASGTTRVEYRLGSRILAVEEVTLNAGASQRVSVETTVPALPPGDYDHGMYIARTTQGTGGSIRINPGQARFSVSNLQAPATGATGDSINVEAAITNTGNAAGETEIQYRFDGDTLGTQTVSLDVDGEETVTFDTTVPDSDAGSYSHGIFIGSSDRGQTSSFSVSEPPSTATPTATQTATGGSGPGFGVGTAIGGAGASGLLAYLSRTVGASPAEETETDD